MRKPVTLATIRAKAMRVLDDILAREDLSETQRNDTQAFHASKNCAMAFTSRHALRSVSLHGEAGSASALNLSEDISKLRENLRDYALSNIYNMDETGLFYRLFPRTTYVLQAEGKRSVRGLKSMHAKDRITAYICTNADDTDKVPLSLIGKDKNPRCFRLERPHVTYFSQKNAWSDTVTFQR